MFRNEEEEKKLYWLKLLSFSQSLSLSSLQARVSRVSVVTNGRAIIARKKKGGQRRMEPGSNSSYYSPSVFLCVLCCA